MTTIDTTIDAPVDPSQLAGTSTPNSEARDRAVANMPAIAADYYNLTEDDGWPVAGLLVMLDRHQQPVRAEVHLYDNTQGRRQDDALHNANRLLITKYWSHSAEESRIPLRVMRTKQALDTLTVQLNVNETVALNPAGTPSWLNRNSIALAIVGLLLATAITYSLLALQGRLGTPGTGSSAGEAPATEAGNTMPVRSVTGFETADPAYLAAMAGDYSLPLPTAAAPTVPVEAAPSAEEAPAADLASPDPVPPAATAEDYVNPFPFESNNLEPSATAYEFSLRDRALVTATALAVQQIPDPEDEHSIHWLTQGTEVELLGGPVWKEGVGDTIVWWFAKAEGDKEGWMAANGGNGQRFLEPLQ